MRTNLVNIAKQRFLLAIGLAIAASIAITSSGFAHANQLRSDPADGSVLKESPREIFIWFDEPISDRFNSVQLFDINSQPIEVTSIRRDSNDPTLLIITIPELSRGVYSVLWKILSEVDGHYNQGLLVFGVGEDVDLGTASVAPVDEPGPSGPEVLFRWLNLLMLSGFVGGIAMIQFVMKPAWSQARNSALPLPVFRSVTKRILNLAIWCAVAAILVGIEILLWQSLTLSKGASEQVSFISMISETLTQTRWGIVWMVRQGLLLGACVSSVHINRKKEQRTIDHLMNWTQPIWVLLFVISLGLTVVQALSSHAAGLVTGNTTLAVVSDGLHFLGATLWMGGLLSLGVVLLPLIRRHSEEIGYLVQVGWKPFSKVAAFSIGLLIATGLYSTGRQVASIDALISTLYGRTLILKLGVLLGIGYFGFFNTSLLHPSLLDPMRKLFGSRVGWTPLEINGLPRHILIKGGLSLLVLLLTGLITASPSPRDSTYTIDPASVPGSLSQSVDDLVVTLSTKPNRPGQNVFTVFAASTRRPPPVEIARVLLRFTYLDQDIGRQSIALEEVEPGRFLLGGNYLRLAGTWQIDVVVRRQGMHDSVASFNWVVAPPGISSPVLASKAPMARTLSLIAAGMLLCIPLHSLIVFWVRQRKLIQRTTTPPRRRKIHIEHQPEFEEAMPVPVTAKSSSTENDL